MKKVSKLSQETKVAKRNRRLVWIWEIVLSTIACLAGGRSDGGRAHDE